MRRTRTLAILGLMGLLAACEAAPVTGRSQLILLPESQDAELGLEAYQQIRDERKISKPRSAGARCGAFHDNRSSLSSMMMPISCALATRRALKTGFDQPHCMIRAMLTASLRSLLLICMDSAALA